MARPGVNAVVALSSAATMAASTLGVMAADGAWSDRPDLSAPAVGTQPGSATDAVQLAPLSPMQLAPLDAPAVRVPVARLQSAPPGLVQAPTPAPAPPRAARRTRAS